jgi:D-alanyl-D-alanine carboxypeptidase (penicillin-binding protein 5/6)
MESVQLFLSVLLLGMVPAPGVHDAGTISFLDLPLSPPAALEAQDFPSRKLSQVLSASGAVIIDLQSGQEIFARNADRRRAMASLTKLMTAVIIAETHSMEEVVEVPKGIQSIDGSKVPLPAGEKFTVGDLLSALLIPSANDAAETLAIHHSGSADVFVQLMNERAASLGLQNTSFANPSGLDDVRQWSTPRDISRLAAYALRNPEIRQRLSTAHSTITSINGRRIVLENTHKLLRQGMVLAGKTGTTNAARQCLFSLVEEHGREYVVVLLGSRERYGDMRAVLRILQNLFA